jgi:methylenetetrahydrofolate reductase (NADPH)
LVPCTPLEWKLGMSTEEPVSANQDHATSDLQSKLRSGEFVVTAEITPPVSGDPQILLDRVLPLKGHADAVNVTDGAGARVSMSSWAASAILVRAGIEPILQMTCRDRNRIALQGDLLGAAVLGVRNVLVLTGDDPSVGDQPEAKPVFDLNSIGLIEVVEGMRDRAELPSGRKIEGNIPYFIGAADMPIDPPVGWVPTGLQAKIAAGAQFVQTQFCMDLEIIRRYVERLREHEVTNQLSILIGIAPLASARSARWMRDNLYGTIIPDSIVQRMEMAEDPAAEGKEICVELLHGLRAIPGIAGAHIMAPRNQSAIADVISKWKARS